MKRLRPVKTERPYRQLWRIVDGAVRDTFEAHPEYLTPAGKRSARSSIAKRVTGAELGYAVQTAKGRSGASPAAEMEKRLASRLSLQGCCDALRRWAGSVSGPPGISRQAAR